MIITIFIPVGLSCQVWKGHPVATLLAAARGRTFEASRGQQQRLIATEEFSMVFNHDGRITNISTNYPIMIQLM